jgi:pectate lyase
MLVEGNVFTGKTREALSTYGLVVPEDSPNTSPDGDFEIDGFANLGASEYSPLKLQSKQTNMFTENDFGKARVNITQVGNFTKAPYKYKLTSLKDVSKVVKKNAGIGKI